MLKLTEGVFNIVKENIDSATIAKKLKDYLQVKIKEHPDMEIPKNSSPEEVIETQIAQITSPWMINFIKHDPAPVLEKVKCNVLVINGDKDLQVPSQVNLPAIENALKKGGNNKYSICELAGLNHLFQECTTGLPKEYAEIEQTFSPVAMEVIAKWINAR